jgi:hypothetical protein
MTKMFQQFSVNKVGKPRFAVMEGRDYIVLPVTILVEGVHTGSTGPTLYTLEDMEKYVPAWNHKPVVVNHPKKDGQFISADSPAVLSTSKVGILMANKIVGKEQQAEVWLEKSRLKEVDERILQMIDNGDTVEVSTGLFADSEDSPGKWNEEEYDTIARNYRPDHLALLPDLIGACSIQDGCGMFTAAQAMTQEQVKKIKLVLNSVFSNELSHDQIRQELADTIWKATQTKQTIEYWTSGYLHEVYDDYVIYCFEDKFFKQSYTTKDDSVELSGDPEEVQREIVYNPISNEGDLDMTKPATNCECKKEIKVLVDGLISVNKDWKEEDREWLQSLDEVKLKKFTTMQTVIETEEEPEAEPKAKSETKETTVNTETPPKKKEQTTKEFIDNSPPEIREMLNRVLAVQEQERKRYTDIILTNESNTFTAEELKAMKPEALKKLADLAVGPRKSDNDKEILDLFSFVGQAGPVQNQTSTEECLPLPMMKFDKK